MKSLSAQLKFYYKAYQRLEIMNKAASLSYYTIISIFPFILLLATVSSYIVSQEVTIRAVTDFMAEAFPYQSELILNNLQTLFLKQKAFSWLGIAALFISAQILFVNFEKTVNNLLHTDKRRNFLVTRLVFLLWLVLVIIVQFFPVAYEFVISKLALYGFEVKNYITYLSRGGLFIFGLFVFLIVMAIIPTRRLSKTRLFFGAFWFSVTLQIGKIIFKWVTLHNLVRYNLIYGSLSSIILGTLWIFYFYNMLLFFVYWVGRQHDPLFEKSGVK